LSARPPFQIATHDQDETDRYWSAIVGNGGQESACGWCEVSAKNCGGRAALLKVDEGQEMGIGYDR